MMRLPVVLTKALVQAVLRHISGVNGLLIRSLYSSGMRLMEGMHLLRVKDVDFKRGEIVVREVKGSKDRITLFPERLQNTLQGHLESVRAPQEHDLAEGGGEVYLPLCACEKILGCEQAMGLAIRIPFNQAFNRSRSGVERWRLHGIRGRARPPP